MASGVPVYDSTTYINIGTTCASFTEYEAATINEICLVAVAGTSVLKSLPNINTGYLATSPGASANLVSLRDYLFNVKFDRNLVYDTTARPNARYLIKQGDTVTPDKSNNKVESTNWVSWPTSPDQNSSILVIYNSTTYAMSKKNNNACVTALRGLLATSISTIAGSAVTVGSTGFYLRRVTPIGGASLPPITSAGNKKYLVISSGVSLTELDIEAANVEASDITANQYKIVIDDTSEVDKIFLKIVKASDDTPITGLNIEYDSTKSPNFSVNRSGVYYCFDTSSPSDEDLTQQPLASVTTLIKFGTSKYLAIEGAPGAPVVKIKDYWTTGYTLNQLKERLMFTWTDLTPVSSSTIPGSTEEINRWNLRDANGASIPGQVVSLNAPASLTISANPSMKEGWALTGRMGTDTGGALIFVRAGSIVGYASVTSGTENVTFVASSSIPANSYDKQWSCVKCSTIDSNNKMCNP